MKYRGVVYYPEAWPSQRWDEDIQLMRDANINIVRMGDFAWARMEPTQGCYDLDWWQTITGKFADAGIKMLLATPGAGPPAWLSTQYPQALAVDLNGQRATHGSRRHYCPSSPIYRECIAQLVRHIAEAVCDNPAVMAWQIDNEIALGNCHCETCLADFRKWLQAHYESLDVLNEAWGNVFWSGDFSDWNQITQPTQRISWHLDYIRFQDDVFTDLINDQAALLRKINPHWRISTNQWAGLNPAANATQFFENLDVACYDGYWDYYADREHYSCVWDFYRNIKTPRQPFWLAETNAWNPSNTGANGLASLRPWVYEAFAKGSEMHLYFRWRQSCMGEEDHPAILDWSGHPGRTYSQIQSIFGEMAKLDTDLRDLPLPEAEVAILFDYNSAVCGLLENRDYREHLVQSNVLLSRMQVLSDILPVHKELDISSYKLVLLPQLEIIDDDLKKLLIAYVQGGGILLAQTRLGTLDRNGKYTTQPIPMGLTELFGVVVRERWPIQNHSPQMMRVFPCPDSPNGPSYVALKWHDNATPLHGIEYMEMLEPNGACTVLATYESGSLADAAAVTSHAIGAGQAIYQGCWLDESSSYVVLERVLAESGLTRGLQTQLGIEIIKRGNLRFYLNHTSKPVTLSLLQQGEALLGNTSDTSIFLAPFDVSIIREQ